MPTKTWACHPDTRTPAHNPRQRTRSALQVPAIRPVPARGDRIGYPRHPRASPEKSAAHVHFRVELAILLLGRP